MGATRPDKPTIRFAVDRAATVRRRRYQDDDRYRHFSETAMLEQVCGDPVAAVALGGGWWLVGRIVDVIAGGELEILCYPGERKIRLREVVGPEPPAPPRPESFAPERPEVRRDSESEGRWRFRSWLMGES